MEFLSSLHYDVLLKIIFVDILLGGDNAIVIAMACASIPLAQRSKAIWLGAGAAIALRVIILALASLIIGIPFIKIAAGLMLLWIGIKLVTDDGGHDEVAQSEKVWEAVKTIAIADVVMSIDNVFAVTGASQATGDHSLMYSIAGILFTIPVIILGASAITKVFDRFPLIIWGGAGLLGWVGAEMIVSDKFFSSLSSGDHLVAKIIGAILVMTIGKCILVNKSEA